ncbi:ATP-binding protein [Heliorestis convoluta]|uniref:4Fe-4S ferredoxin iron-sulfur binding domain protein n=1 Tax=Heliorestis convoluta TaxID=356322 RepID=A0A5Q2MZ98_9FIRM|nr:4Fe-4S binding protein [Heliorestis convoluta]QGG48088.1 4Fe-4S ferredoxin iron-sulfur binding domain protein [Heliorestis convoluta]
MIRKVVSINEEKCVGCGLCTTACQEGALKLINGKAKLVSDAYCDGLGNCLPACPTDAITLEERKADPFDEVAVKKRKAEVKKAAEAPIPCGCPGTQARVFEKLPMKADKVSQPTANQGEATSTESQLRQWPCQLKLVSPRAPFFDNCQLLIAADCTAFAYAGIHQDFMKNKITLIGCPKLDAGDYAEKLTEILSAQEIQSVTVLRMEVPCCAGIVNSVKKALSDSGKVIPWQIVTIGTDGRIVNRM